MVPLPTRSPAKRPARPEAPRRRHGKCPGDGLGKVVEAHPVPRLRVWSRSKGSRDASHHIVTCPIGRAFRRSSPPAVGTLLEPGRSIPGALLVKASAARGSEERRAPRRRLAVLYPRRETAASGGLELRRHVAGTLPGGASSTLDWRAPSAPLWSSRAPSTSTPGAPKGPRPRRLVSPVRRRRGRGGGRRLARCRPVVAPDLVGTPNQALVDLHGMEGQHLDRDP